MQSNEKNDNDLVSIGIRYRKRMIKDVDFIVSTMEVNRSQFIRMAIQEAIEKELENRNVFLTNKK